MLRPRRRTVHAWPERQSVPGISVVIPSRNGKDLLAAQLPGIVRELEAFDSEIIVVDNGSTDDTAGWLAAEWPRIQVEISDQALSFARAVNRGIAGARHSRICLLNNDMILEPGFFLALTAAFGCVPDLFCATAQIFFPPGVRREETGKAVYAQPEPEDFPIRCDLPLEGEDLTWVLYGSGGCSLYDAAKLRALGSLDEAYEPVYVEDLDIGYRAWHCGWATVYVAGARLEHRHRATSSRYFSEEQLDEILERNYLKFVARAASDQAVFTRLWRQALDRLRLRAPRFPAAFRVLREAWRIALEGGAPEPAEYSEGMILALSGGQIAVMPGATPPRKTVTVVAGSLPDPSLPGTVLVTFTDRLEPPQRQLLERCAEVVLVARDGGPAAFRAALQQTLRKWRPSVVRLEGAEMEQFDNERYFLNGGISSWTCSCSP